MAIAFEVAVSSLLIFVPGLNTALGFSPTAWGIAWGVPFAVVILAYDQARKDFLRHNKNRALPAPSRQSIIEVFVKSPPCIFGTLSTEQIMALLLGAFT